MLHRCGCSFVGHAAFDVHFFFNDTATTEIYTLSLHDALPISTPWTARRRSRSSPSGWSTGIPTSSARSEEHTSELQSRGHLVCRLLLEKKKIAEQKEQSAGYNKVARYLRD